MHWLLALLLASGVSCLASIASAKAPATLSAAHSVNPAPQQNEVPVDSRRWYGWKTLIVDGAALSLVGAALVVELPERSGDEHAVKVVLGGAALVYAVGGPTIHLVQRRPWHALASLGMRGGLPIVGAVVWEAVSCPSSSRERSSVQCGMFPLLFGLTAGALAAMALDASLLAWDRASRATPTSARLMLAPVLSNDGQRELRLIGTF